MALFTKINLAIFVLILLWFYNSHSTSASSFHSQSETRNSGLVPGCASGYRKLGLMICENAGDSTKLVSEAQR
ncbi:hypothetical protein DCAR_0936129 [Daucus carota subsp. sativus]|uniref:Uncharacterized protein n=1 Tax=Daucus carota subsp. sativus TaxID=79200 RepID=A0A175YJD3_DAUCS|nr:hypothetical protein DCAR_0936129 [Daucus carota subsp. sativus]